MFGRVSRYDEHPPKMSFYKQVIGRSSMPSNLPLSSEKTGQSPWRIIVPMLFLFLFVTKRYTNDYLFRAALIRGI